MMLMHVVYIGDLFGFPDGQAGSSYVRLLCRGLVQAGCRVRVLIPNTTESAANSINTQSSGNVDGIDFEYTTGTPIEPPSWLGRKWSHVRGRLGTQLRLAHLKQHGELDCLILYSRSYRRLLEMQRLCQVLNIPLIAHLVEWKQNRSCPTEKENRDSRLFHNEVFERIDAAIVISHYLEELASSGSIRRSNPLPVIRIPVLADLQKWSQIPPARRNRPYLLYCASLDGYIEDALFIVRAAACLKIEDLDLVMVGKASPVTQQRIYQVAKECEFTDKIDLQSRFLPEEALHALYAGAEALLAPLQDNEVSQARFPFKLAGYLAAGTPVVSCQVGEIQKYLVDGRTAFLSRPGDLDHFAEKICEALTSPNRAQVAHSGQQIAQKYFDYHSQGDNLISFIRELILTRVGR